MEPSNDVSWAQDQIPLLGLGPIVPLWVSLGLADFLVKMLIDLCALLPFRLAIAKYAQKTV